MKTISLNDEQIKAICSALSAYRSLKLGKILDISHLLSTNNNINNIFALSNLVKKIDSESTKIDESDAPEDVKTVNQVHTILTKAIMA